MRQRDSNYKWSELELKQQFWLFLQEALEAEGLTREIDAVDFTVGKIRNGQMKVEVKYKGRLDCKKMKQLINSKKNRLFVNNVFIDFEPKSY